MKFWYGGFEGVTLVWNCGSYGPMYRILPKISFAGGHTPESNPTQDRIPITAATSVDPVRVSYIIVCRFNEISTCFN